MKVAYVTKDDPRDICAWSGLVVHILTALQSAGLEVRAIGSLVDHDVVAIAKGFVYGRVFSRAYIKDREPSVLRGYAAQLEKRLSATSYDVAFSPSVVPLAYLNIKKPVVLWHDATVAGLVNFYPGYDRWCAESIANGIKAEQRALTLCRLAIYSSEWAAGTAIENYDVDPAKVKVVPFGANVDCDRDTQDIEALVEARDRVHCRLLFAGVEWARKGGDIAVDVAAELNRRGIPTELHIVGCIPPGTLPGFVRLHGFVSKASAAGRRTLDDLFSRSHFLILPTRADCTPLVVAEACSFGLPVLATNVGGLPTIVRDGKNGYSFAVGEASSAYCGTIERLWSARQEYERLALSSFREYSERLNWGTAGRKVAGLLEEFCG